MYRQQRGPFIPNFSVAVRMLLLIRAAGAMYNVISDCDEGESPVVLQSTVAIFFFLSERTEGQR